jgi:hypothetical protein
MKAILLTIWGVCLSLAIAAQNETAVVLHAVGQVQYFSTPKAAPKRVYPGLELQTSGRIRCLKGGSAKILYQGCTFSISGGRLQEISEVVKAATTSTQLGFTGRFWNFITESMQESESTEKLKKHHRRYMSKTSGSIKGYATTEHAIATSLLTMGKLPAANITFKWRNTKGSGPYTFMLTTENGAVVAHLLTRDTFLTLDLEQLAMDFQGEYQWTVTRNNGQESSATLPFALTSKAVETAEQSLDKQEEFKTANASEQRLMVAYLLEQENCFYNANEVYQNLLAAEPQNILVSRLYAAFLARMDLLPEGNRLIVH